MGKYINLGWLGLLLASGCNHSSSGPPRANPATATPVAVQTVRAARGEVSRSITLPGTLLPYQQALLCAKVAGYVKSLAVDQGDSVKQGDVLAELEVPELVADEGRFKAEVQVAALEYQRVKGAQAKAPDLVVPQSVDNAKARLEVAQANLGRNETLLGFAKIVAPFSGVITRRLVDPGAFIPAATSSSSSNSGLLWVMDFTRVRLQVAVPEVEVPFIREGLPAHVRLEELPQRHVQGAVTRYAHALDPLTKTMLTEFELPNPDGALRPGMFASVQLEVERKTNALLVPIEGLVVEKTAASVFTLAGNQARKVVVKVGFNDGKHVELLDGVHEGDPIILTGKQVLSNGQEVTATEAK